MQQRAVIGVIAVVLLIIACAWWLSAQAEVVDVPPTSPPLVERAEPPTIPVPVAVPSLPEPVVVQPAAAPDAGLAEVEIEVFEGPKHLVGVRVELEGPGGRVGRPTDIMGFARFTLPTGAWRITKPEPRKPQVVPYDGGSRQDWGEAWERAQTTPLEVTAPLTRFRIELPVVRKLRGLVVYANMQPAAGADVSWAPFGSLESTVTDTTGVFTIETTEEALPLQAKRGSAHSPLRTASPGQPLKLVLEEWTQLKVDATPKKGGCLFVRVMHRDEIVAVGCEDEPMLVPVGHLSVLARKNIRGRAHSGRARIDALAGLENHVEVELSPTPPITGTLVDAAGKPMPGLGLHIRQVELRTLADAAGTRAPQTTLTALLRRADGGVPPLAATIRTNYLGEFEWMPAIDRSPDPIYQVLVVELWQTKADPVLVKLDDAPLSIVVEPTP